MKRIKDIINALKVITLTPSKTIRAAWTRCLTDIAEKGTLSSEEERTLINNLMGAIIVIAEDMEKPAKAESEAAK